MDYPDYDPSLQTTALTDQELDELDALLQQLPADEAMNVEALDGFLTALAASPGTLARLRTREWMPAVWGGDGDGAAPFASGKRRKRTVLLVLRHLHAIEAVLRDRPDDWQPVFSVAETEAGEIIDAEDWCIGFLAAIGLDAEAWAPLFDDAEFGPALVPLALLGGDDAGLSDADRERLQDPFERDELSRAVAEVVPRLRGRATVGA
ncbi:YecA family protein [Rubrivivax gelatinosus]|uniref:UPF0149 family protein n=1 Tax=Rubrivivax gelatinosus TaxID=28068 RepID=UPI0019045F40|nr:YecA family protein [Rubrivivax gelatinosus]